MNFCYVVAASDNYRAGLTALLNSLAEHSAEAEVALLSFRLGDDFLEQVEERGGVRVYHSEGDHQVTGTAIERFRLASDLAPHYDALCLLDCDMFMTAPCDLFLDVAAAGFIVTGSNGMVINFGPAHQERYQIDLGSPDYPYAKVHCTAPIFINEANIDWFDALYNSRRIDSWDDFLYLNVLGIHMGKDKKMIVMPPYAFTGIHHYHIKPVTGVMEKAGTLLSGTEEQVYMCHGKYWDEAYNADLLKVMAGYWRDEQLGERQERQAQNSLAAILKAFEHYYNGGALVGLS